MTLKPGERYEGEQYFEEDIDELMKDIPPFTGKNYFKNDFRVVTREAWNAGALTASEPLTTPVSELVVFSETGTDWCYTEDECVAVVKKLQEQHLAEGYSDIKYNFLLAMDDRAYEGTGWQHQAGQIPGHDDLHKKCLSIAYIGIYEDWVKPQRLRDLTENFLNLAKENNYITGDYKTTNINCGKGEINEVMDIIEERSEGKRSMCESAYL